MILIALGANLPASDGGTALDTCRWAATRLDRLPGLRLRGLSAWYETAAQPPSGQPSYVNGMAQLGGDVDPVRLLAVLHALEAEAGRVRTVPNAARPLDLDLIGVGGLVLDGPAVVLPHPRAHLRAFVLAPLLDVAPTWRHPILGQDAASMLAEVADQAMSRLPA